MVRILKYPLPAHGEAIIEANVVRWLHVEWVHGELFIWAEVSGHTSLETPMRCRLVVALTGDEPPASAEGYRSEHLGTAVLQLTERSYVVHVYRVWP
jgi:hypothetical protein